MDKRLLKIAEITGCVNTVMDIGTDHGYLPVYLIENKKAQSAIVSDVSLESLNKANRLIHSLGLSDKIESREGGGFSILHDKDEIDVAIIAGMGGNLIASILEDADSLIWQKNIRLILQPMQNPEVLRKYLLDHSYYIKSENLVQDDRFIYQIIEALPGGENAQVYNELELAFGKKTSYDEEALTNYMALLKNKKQNIELIIEKIKESDASDKESIMDKYKNQIKLIEESL